MDWLRQKFVSYLPGLYRVLLRTLKPITEKLGKIHIAPHERAVTARHVLALEDHLAPGDILLSYSKGELTNWFIDGEYKHCAMYVGMGEIVEAVGSGVRVIDIEDFCASKDKICVVRPSFCTGEESLKAVNYAVKQKGAQYDYTFEPNESAFYCAELIAQAYQVATNFTSPFFTREIMGIMTVLPVDFKLAKSKFHVTVEVP